MFSGFVIYDDEQLMPIIIWDPLKSVFYYLNRIELDVYHVEPGNQIVWCSRQYRGMIECQK